MTNQTLESKNDIPRQDPHDDNDHGKDMVRITVDDKPVEIHRGRRTVREIKELGHVPVADELAQVIPGHTPAPLPDDGSIVIKGGEEFVSYPKDSGSSHDSLPVR